MEPPSHGTNTGAGLKNISCHSRHKRNRFPVSAVVHGFTTGKCGLLPQHFHHGINISVVIILLQYLIPAGFVLVGSKIIIIVIIIT